MNRKGPYKRPSRGTYIVPLNFKDYAGLPPAPFAYRPLPLRRLIAMRDQDRAWSKFQPDGWRPEPSVIIVHGSEA